jgi:transposase, IS5 family
MVSGCGKGTGFPARIERAFDWTAFKALFSPIHASTRGAPGYPPLVMFKILLLQQWHTLSDPAPGRRFGTDQSFAVCAGCRWR